MGDDKLGLWSRDMLERGVGRGCLGFVIVLGLGGEVVRIVLGRRVKRRGKRRGRW